MFKFNKESGCVKVWVTLIMGGTYKVDQVPKLFNLKECVEEVLKEVGFIKEENPIEVTEDNKEVETPEEKKDVENVEEKPEDNKEESSIITQ